MKGVVKMSVIKEGTVTTDYFSFQKCKKDITAELKKVVKDTNITLEEISKKTGIKVWKIRTILNNGKYFSFNDIIKIAAILGYKISLAPIANDDIEM